MDDSETYRWPYEDLALVQPRCPGCGAVAHAELVDRAISPLYFCIADGCPVFAWDPSKKAPGDTAPHS